MAENELPPRPGTLGDLYNALVKTFPKLKHNENEFICLMIKDMERDGMRTYSMRQWIENQKMNLVIYDDWRLDDFQWGCIAYLESLKISNLQIKKIYRTFNFWKYGR